MTIDVTNILLIDSYDSFTNNLAALIQKAIPDCRIYIIKNDQFTKIRDLIPYLRHFSAVVVGPGPGSPQKSEDIGIVEALWQVPNHHLIPIFGVCLGLQSLCLEYGAEIQQLDHVKHGQISQISHNSSGLFNGVNSPLFAVRYHSLHAKLPVGGDLDPLAWADDGLDAGKILMAVQHKSRPFWAVQYHPESVQTDDSGIRVIQNFWHLAQQWTRKSSREVVACPPTDIFGFPWSSIRFNRVLESLEPLDRTNTVLSKVISLSHFNMAALCESFGALDESSPFVLLDSASSPGRYSILACLSSSSLRISYHLSDSEVRLTRNDSTTLVNLAGQDIWSWISSFMNSRRAISGPNDSPFWGGLAGTLSYELGVQTTLCVPVNTTCNSDPAVNLIFVERSIVVDAETKKVYVQSLIDDDEMWIENTAALLSSLPAANGTGADVADKSSFHLPNRDQYIGRIHQAMESLNTGDSYELCLTAKTKIQVPRRSSWERYKRLRQKNPAPFSAYIRLHPMTLLSSSPERFLSFTRPPHSKCQLRPIKGTVRKHPGLTRAAAEQALVGSVKEVAENLMIVDLIRHDLHGVVGEDVTVTQFCGVEEYETVFQLVSVIEGSLSSPSNIKEQLGWEVLRRSLPPGSMTGAPKKRSVEILQQLEDSERGIYSGVFGYLCVSGAGDWAVTIRSCVKHGGSTTTDDLEEWSIGAGGAITALSDPEAEWEEMLVKLNSALRSFNTGS